MKASFFVRVIGILMILVMLVGCSTTMHVNAVDTRGNMIDGASVMVDDQFIGNTPGARTRVSNAVWETTQIRVTKDGFHTAVVDARQQIKVPNLVAGILLSWTVVGLIPLLWVWGPRAQQHVVLQEAPAR